MEAAAGELDYEQARTLSVSALCACDVRSVLTTWNSAAGPAWRRVGGLCPGRGSCRCHRTPVTSCTCVGHRATVIQP